MSERKEKFTPGPWVIYPVSVNSESCDIVKQDDTNDRIAVTCEQSMNEGRELANAHLIAAAPELYDVVDEFINELPACSCHNGFTERGRVDPSCIRCYFGDLVDRAIATRAKARGEA